MAGNSTISVQDIAAAAVSEKVDLNGLQHLQTIGVVDASQNVASVLSLPNSSWFVNLVLAADTRGGVDQTTKEIGALFKDKGAVSKRMKLNNVEDCDVIIDNQDNWFWLHNGQLLPLFSDGNGGYVVTYQGANYAIIDLSSNFQASQLIPQAAYVFREDGATHFGVDTQYVNADVCYVDAAGVLVTAKKGSYILGYRHNHIYNHKVISSTVFQQSCTSEADLSGVGSNDYFLNKLRYINQKAVICRNSLSTICDMLEGLANNSYKVPSLAKKMINRITDTEDFTAYNKQKNDLGYLYSGSYKYATMKSPDGNIYATADFSMQIDSEGVVLSVNVTSDGVTLLSYEKGGLLEVH